jgi:hypothetical protein
MTHRTTLDLPVTGIQYGIPYVTSDQAESTTTIDEYGNKIIWSGVQIQHKPEPGTTGTATVGVYKQSDDTLVAETLTTGTVYLYYPNNPEYANVNLTSNQGICEWDTYYYMGLTPNTPTERREQIIIRKLTTTIR